MVNDILITCADKDWYISHDDRNKLCERKNYLNNQFIFTDKVIQRIREINTFLKNEESRIRSRAIQIHQYQGQMLADKIIDDYEIDYELRLWNFSGHYAALDEYVFDGNPFYIDRTLLIYEPDSSSECFFSDNWNELPPTHPLGNEFFCYTFHAIYDHSPLAWEDILQIEEFDLCLTVCNHFESKQAPHPC